MFLEASFTVAVRTYPLPLIFLYFTDHILSFLCLIFNSLPGNFGRLQDSVLDPPVCLYLLSWWFHPISWLSILSICWWQPKFYFKPRLFPWILGSQPTAFWHFHLISNTHLKFNMSKAELLITSPASIKKTLSTFSPPSSHRGSYNWLLKSIRLNCVGPLICRFFFSGKYNSATWLVESLDMDLRIWRRHLYRGLTIS